MKNRYYRPLINARKRRRVSPLKADPTRTATLRRRFQAELRRRFARLKAKVLRLIVEQDALGLVPRVSFWTFNEDWRYLASPEKIKAFELWLRQQLAADLLGLSEQQTWEKFIREGFEKGAGRAFDDTKRSEAVKAAGEEKLDFYVGTRDEFLRSSFAQPVAVEKVKLLAGRSFTDLKGITDAMSTALTRGLVDGLVRGQSPREIGRSLADLVDVSRSRAETIAQTEIIRAHAEGQLKALEDMGVEEVGVMVEFSTAGDGRVCARCTALNGVTLKIDEARGLIPVHPRCRCAFLPANVGEDTTGQKRTQRQIEKAAAKADVDLEVSKTRPESILR